MERFFTYYAYDVFFNDDDDEEEEYLLTCTINFPKRRKCIKDFFELTIPQYTDFDFKSHFRLDRSTVEFLLHEIAPLIIKSTSRVLSPIPKQVLITLWFLGNQEVFRSIADRFNVSKSTAHETAYRIIDSIIISCRRKFILWPNEFEAHRISNAFMAKNDFPAVIGCNDGSHIPICKPAQDADSYINRKGYHSLLMQGVCDNKRRFIDFTCGWPGSVDDARVFRRSELGQICQENPDALFFNNMHLLGDSAYPLNNYLLTPYRDNGRLTRREKRFNYCLSSIRIIIEHTFGILKTRFRILKYVNLYKTNLIPKILLACAILHNICINNDDNVIEDINLDVEYEENIFHEQDRNENVGVLKRNYISSIL